jgi:localization factor PodJL
MRGDQLMQEGQSAAACDWYRQGAERGHAPAQSRLARCFETGVGLQQDARRARLWYTQALLEDDAAAVAGMARLAENGPASAAQVR